MSNPQNLWEIGSIMKNEEKIMSITINNAKCQFTFKWFHEEWVYSNLYEDLHDWSIEMYNDRKAVDTT
jgi:hypothetical protein